MCSGYQDFNQAIKSNKALVSARDMKGDAGFPDNVVHSIPSYGNDEAWF